MYEELVKQCRGCLDSLCGECKYEHLQNAGNFVPCMNALLGEAVDAIEVLSKTEKTTRWIPVAERLPEIGEKVLVFAYSNATLTARMCEQTENGYPVFECNGIFLEMAKPGRITHWMPPPEPPKEGE